MVEGVEGSTTVTEDMVVGEEVAEEVDGCRELVGVVEGGEEVEVVVVVAIRVEVIAGEEGKVSDTER